MSEPIAVAERFEAALLAEYELRKRVIENGSWGDAKESIQAQLVSLFLTEGECDSADPWTAFESRPIIPPVTVAFKAKALRRLVPRVLFKTEKYSAASLGGMVRAFVGGIQKSGVDKPILALDTAIVSDQIKIVAVHEVCSRCKGTGHRDGAGCGFEDYGGSTCALGLMSKGGLAFDAGDLLESARRAEPKAGWEALMDR